MIISRGVLQQSAMATGALICVLSAPAARAQDASPWEPQPHAAVRLIAGAARKAASAALLRAGVEIRLDPGWKTYWRYPGDSGVPPTFDFAGSKNVKSVIVLWPAPERFADGAGGHSVGYVGDVILPLHVTPQDAEKPASLHIKLSYAICGNLCIPSEAELSLDLSGKTGSEEAALLAAETRVPRHLPLGSRTNLAVTSVHRERNGNHERVVVDVTAPEGAPVELLVEGPTPDWALPLPELAAPAATAPAQRRFTFDLDGLPPGAQAAGAALTFTAVSPTDAIEVEAHLD
jgi:DsbC/DsbD-like thiol-disulfide interchange protein